jgi:hypothetical protein
MADAIVGCDGEPSLRAICLLSKTGWLDRIGLSGY